MLPAERHQRIVAMLSDSAVVATEDLAASLSVSAETVRRDLKLLESKRRLVRVHGGAALRAMSSQEPPFATREKLGADAKEAIGRRAAALVDPGMTVMIDVGTTALAVARELPPEFHGCVVTCSLLVAAHLADRDGIEVLVSGGRLRGGDLAVSNHLATSFFADVKPDLAFLGSGGVHSTAGLTDFHLDEVATRRVVLRNAARSYVLADAGKLEQVAPHRVCDLGELAGVITDGSPDELAEALDREGVELLVAT